MQKREIIHLTLFLTVLSALAAGALAFTYNLTNPIIEQNKELALQESLREILPAADKFELQANPEGVTAAYLGLSDGKPVGMIIKVGPKGYGGTIEMLVGIDNNKKLTGIKIMNMNETPGLGSKAKEPKFKDQFNNKPAGEFTVVKRPAANDQEVQAISGATITSRAVTKGVNDAVQYFLNHYPQGK